MPYMLHKLYPRRRAYFENNSIYAPIAFEIRPEQKEIINTV